MSERSPVRERKPRPVLPRRMERLASLPVFFRLAGKRVVIAGGDEAAVWKAELLSAAGASVEAWAEHPCETLEALAADPPAGTVTLIRRRWIEADLSGATLVIASARDDADAAAIYEAARSAGVPVNVIDKPRFCTFQFGAIVNRSPLVVGISTDGAAPVFGQAIRSRIEAMLPAGFARWAAVAQGWRRALDSQGIAAGVRRRFWEGFAALAVREPDRQPKRRDRVELLAAAVGEGGASARHGHVMLVGAGPGDPELMTLKAVRALRSADVILFDDLVAPEILDYARREAKRMLVGKTGYAPSCQQADVTALMLSLARSGKRVVRLKSGDPMIFGRAGEELAALERAQVSCEVIPGISAAQGAASSLKVPLTHRRAARRLQMVTGHSAEGRLPDDLDVASIVDPHTTTAVYMPLGTLSGLMRRVLALTREPDRPVCAVFNATRPNEMVVWGTVASIDGAVQAAKVRGPCVVLFGEVLRRSRARCEDQPQTDAAIASMGKASRDVRS